MDKNFSGKIPSWPQLKQIFKIMSKKEKYVSFASLFLALFFLFVFLVNLYTSQRKEIPAYGGGYSEALVGQPQFINPILAVSDVDRDLSKLIYSGLVGYDEDGNLIMDLAKSYSTKDGKEYIFKLKEGIFWHDGKIFNADDVVFTVNAILNPDYGSPLRSVWQGVKVEKIDDYTVKFILDNPYAMFLETLTVGILPRHIWESMNPKNIILSPMNLTPVGTGPFKVEKIIKSKLGYIKSIRLSAFDDYHKKRPYFNDFEVKFYDDEEQAINAYQKGDVLGVAYVSAQNKGLLSKENTNIYKLKTPTYFSVFFNQNRSLILADLNVRKALAYSVDKSKVFYEALLRDGIIVDSPIPPHIFGHNENVKKYKFDLKKAKEILKNNGWKDLDGDGVLEKKLSKKDKEPTKLSFSLVTLDSPDLTSVAQILVDNWKKIGVDARLEAYSIEEMTQSIIKERRYDAILFGESLLMEPDPFVFWHSSQKKSPGLNLALYGNRSVDKLLEEMRQKIDKDQREKILMEFQEKVVDDLPAIFLYSKLYLYPVNKKIKGISVKKIATYSDRFTGIENWYIKTQLVPKD